jgi:hypothetical protein
MRLFSKVSTSLFALALTIGFSTAAMAADKATDKGTIKGTVTGTDGAKAANVQVRVTLPGGPGGKKPEPKAADAKAAKQLADKQLADKPAPGDKPAAGEKPAGRKGPEAVATATTGTDGSFTVEVPAGEYSVRAGGKDIGTGMEKVNVKAGETVTVSITLKAPKAK